MAQDRDNAPNKPVHLIYLCGGLLTFIVLKWTIDWLWGFFTRVPDEFYVTFGAALISLVGGIALYRNEKVRSLIDEVVAELQKVTWPGAKEVKSATIVTVVMTILSAAILGSFDFVWANVTDFIYGG